MGVNLTVLVMVSCPTLIDEETSSAAHFLVCFSLSGPLHYDKNFCL